VLRYVTYRLLDQLWLIVLETSTLEQDEYKMCARH